MRMAERQPSGGLGKARGADVTAETPVRLSIEECVYWAVMTESNGITRATATRDTHELRHTVADIESWLADNPNEGPWSAMMRRRGRFRVWLCRQAEGAIARERGGR